MPFARPTRSELVAAARTEIETRLPGSDARLRRSMLDVIARIIAAGVHGLYGLLDWVTRQCFADTAEDEFLRRWGALYGVQEIPPQFAIGPVTFTGSNLATIPDASLVRRADGREYQTLEEATISAGTATVNVLAVEPGRDGNSTAGTTLTLLSPLPGVQSAAEVAAGGIVGGTDVETDESLRARIVARIQRPPGGGTVSDYVAQTKLWPEVTDVYVFSPHLGVAGDVGVAPLFYDRPDPIPTAGDLAGIQDLLEDPNFKPVTATPIAYALVAVAVAFNIHLVGSDTASIRAAIEADVRDLFRREATPGGVIKLSHIREVISQAAGEVDHVLVAPTTDIDLAGDVTKLSTPGAFTWS